MAFAINMPAAVPMEKAIAPSAKIPKVSTVKNLSADNFEPTANPKKIVTTLINSFCALLLNLSTTPDSFIRLPKQNIPTKGVAVGKNKIHRNSTAKGKMIFSRLDTVLS